MSNNISFSAIHTFTVVAKELSFTRTAKTLHITPSAVSHQMKSLENQMGVTLFHRQAKGVRLSLAGETLQRYAKAGVKNIQYGILQSQFANQKEKLVIAVIPSLCQLWLMPRLVEFCELFPQIEIELVALDQLADFNSGHYDGHIHFGSGIYSGCEAKLLCNETIYPVCHPDLLNELNNTSVKDLLTSQPLLIYKAGIEDDPGGISWSHWLRSFNIIKSSQQNQLWFSHVAMALLAAKLKQGIALGWHHMVCDDIDNGVLVRLDDSEMSTSFDYYLVAPSQSWQNQSFKHFANWLEEKMVT